MPSNVEPPVPASPLAIAALLAAAVQGADTPDDLLARAGLPGSEGLGDVARQLDHLGVVAWGPQGLRAREGVDARDLAIRWAAWEAAGSAAPDLDRLRDLVSAVAPSGPRTAATWTGAPELAVADPEATARWRARWASVSAGLVDRDDLASLAVRTLLSRDNLLLLGPPGTGKSLLARRVGALLDGEVFEALLSRFTQPDELFGPLDVAALRDGVYRRRTSGYLPSADLAFLDELFKGGVAVLNTLLGVLNERTFHEGNQRHALRLQAVVGASNELPAREDALHALLDRFLVRVEVAPVRHAAGLLGVVASDAAIALDPEAVVTPQALEAIRVDADAVTVPYHVQQGLVALWRHVTAAGLEVSDRRWKAAVRWLRVGAAAEARRRLDLDDLLALDAVLAVRGKDRTALSSWLASTCSEGGAAMQAARADAIRVSLDRVRPGPDEPLVPTETDPWDRRAVSVRRARAQIAASREALSRRPRAWEVADGPASSSRLRALAMLEAQDAALAGYALTLTASGEGPVPAFQSPT